jgi:hypothetical protein
MINEIVDLTEPQDMEIIEAVDYNESPWLWRVELYLVSKYMPEFYESSVFKMRTAALARHRFVAESHHILQGIQALDTELTNDLNRIPMVPQNSPHKRVYAKGVGISDMYQKQIDEEFGR